MDARYFYSLTAFYLLAHLSSGSSTMVSYIIIGSSLLFFRFSFFFLVIPIFSLFCGRLTPLSSGAHDARDRGTASTRGVGNWL